MKYFESDFEFLGDRKYVNSSTMIDDLVGIVDEMNDSASFCPETIDAQFHSEIQGNGRFYIAEKRSQLDKMDLCAAANFVIKSAEQSVAVSLVETSGRPVSKGVPCEYHVDEMILNGDYSGTCRVDCSTRWGLISNIIEANKRIHLLTLHDHGKNARVVNLYMRNFPLILPERVGSFETVLLKIDNLGIRQQNDSFATLNLLSFPGLDMKQFEVSFVFYEIN